MISAGRILTIFRKKGRSGEFTKLASEFLPEQLVLLRNELDEPPLIVKLRSTNDWFVITKSHLLLKHAQRRQRLNLEDVHSILNDIREHAEGKHHGGTLRLKLRDGRSVGVLSRIRRAIRSVVERVSLSLQDEQSAKQ
jgi:hypothetical protein